MVRPYGDATGDGMVQVSFTLPLPAGKRAEGAAAQLAQKMGIEPALVVHARAMGPDFTFFVVYGPVRHLVDVSAVQVIEREYPLLSAKEVNAAVKARLRRKLVVVGACIGTDAHTVGIDAILNIKGFAGEKGLEYYRELKVVNLGAQVPVPELVERAVTEKADAVLVSQVVTQRDAHVHNTMEMSAAFREALPAHRRPLLIVGGPRFDESAAAELGVDRVFGRGTTPARSPVPGARAGSRGCRPGEEGLVSDDPHLGLTVTHTRYVPYSHAHYAGNLVDGAYSLACFGDVATEVCIRTDGDEGLFASYSDVQFLAPVRAGDVLEVTATVVRVGRRSREIEFAATVVCRGRARPWRERGRGPRPARRGDPGPRHRRRGPVEPPCSHRRHGVPRPCSRRPRLARSTRAENRGHREHEGEARS